MKPVAEQRPAVHPLHDHPYGCRDIGSSLNGRDRRSGDHGVGTEFMIIAIAPGTENKPFRRRLPASFARIVAPMIPAGRAATTF
jgi:hypothetical protein